MSVTETEQDRLPKTPTPPNRKQHQNSKRPVIPTAVVCRVRERGEFCARFKRERSFRRADEVWGLRERVCEKTVLTSLC